MRKLRRESRISRDGLARDGLVQGGALVALLLLAAWAVFGPSGLLSWSEHRQLLEIRKAEVAALEKDRDELRNRVALLDPRHADPDLTGELLRSDLNVVHPDEMVMMLR